MEKEQEFKIKKYITIGLLVIVGLFVAIKFATAQSITKTIQLIPIQETYVYRDLGMYIQKYPDGSAIGIHAYIIKGTNKTGNYEQYSNAFALMAESTSIYKNLNVPTWLYGARVFMNTKELSATQYPIGFTAYVKTNPTPTIIYYWYTNDEDVNKFYFSWESSAYEITK